ncbi:Snrpb2 U2 small nuclear ribonucleoprotein B'' [Candida maltosa Xu316]
MKRSNTDIDTESKKIKLDYTNLKPSQTLYVKNLNNKINNKVLLHNLYLLFSAFGDVISINLRNGFVFIVYASLNSATLALRNLQKESFFEKELQINYADKQSKVITKALQGKGEDDNEEDDVMPSYE